MVSPEFTVGVLTSLFYPLASRTKRLPFAQNPLPLYGLEAFTPRDCGNINRSSDPTNPGGKALSFHSRSDEEDRQVYAVLKRHRLQR